MMFWQHLPLRQGVRVASRCCGLSHIDTKLPHYCRYLSSAAPIDEGLLNRDQIEYLPDGITRQPDFFEEGITFIKDLDPNHIKSTNQHEKLILCPNQKSTSQSVDNITDALSTFDNICLTIISKGCANIHEGNDGEGPEVRAWHASAIGWAELLLHASKWNQPCGDKNISAAPMLAVAAVAPVVAQGGIHYLHRIDGLLSKSSFADRSGSLVDMARYATAFRDVFVSCKDTGENDVVANVNSSPILSPRERWHLHALDQLLQNNHRQAMGAYLRLLEFFPGDLLGLSLALDVAYTLGDAQLALRAATNVASYWGERDTGSFGGNHAHPGHTVATSLLAIGLASSSSAKSSIAERLADSALQRDADSAGGNTVWALVHSLGGEGRSQEMVSRLATSDGVRLYERSGYLAFNTRMSGYGAMSLLDTQRAGSDRSAIRLYDGSFGHVLQYSGNDVHGAEKGGEDVCMNELDVPRSVKDDMKGAVKGIFSGLFGNDQSNSETSSQSETKPQNRSAEAVLTWLPPSPLLITHATALLLRLTLDDAIFSSDDRWGDIKTAWGSLLQNELGNSLTQADQTPIEFMPLAMVAASLLFEPQTLHKKPISCQMKMAMKGLHLMGKLKKFGQPKIQTTTPNDSKNAQTDEWRKVLTCLSHAIDPTRWEMPSGVSSPTYLPPSHLTPRGIIGWDFDTRQFLEYSLCHAAIKAGDYESLCVAKAICSEGATLRSNCPEMWIRYAKIMDQLGDNVAAENARAASVSMGGGEGSSAF